MTSGHPAATLSTSSPLPSGVTFTPGPGGTATIQGTPDVGTGGVYVITINGTNGTPPDATFVFTLTVREAPVFTATVANDVATVGSAHASAEYVTKATPAATLSATGLPAGLSLTSSGAGKAKITGTPANGTGGEYDITITATNGVSPDAQTVTHLVVNEAPELTGPTNARLVATFAGNVAYSADGYPGAAISAAGPIPSGLTFHDNGNGTAQISGTPDLGTDGTYAITITAHNGIDPDAVVHLTLVIAPPLTITTTSLPNAPVGTPYGASVVAAGGLPPYVFTLDSGTLPAGLSLAADGSISGTPTGPTGTASFVVRVTDSADPAQTFTKPLSITVVKGNTTLSVEPVLLNLSTGPLGLQVYLGLVKAKLTGGSPAQPIAGQTIVWTVNGAPVCSAVTDATGTASCLMNLGNTLLAVLSGNITGTYAGNALWNGSTGSNGLATIT
jgi:hypothetical protein